MLFWKTIVTKLHVAKFLFWFDIVQISATLEFIWNEHFCWPASATRIRGQQLIKEDACLSKYGMPTFFAQQHLTLFSIVGNKRRGSWVISSNRNAIVWVSGYSSAFTRSKRWWTPTTSCCIEQASSSSFDWFRSWEKLVPDARSPRVIYCCVPASLLVWYWLN